VQTPSTPVVALLVLAGCSGAGLTWPAESQDPDPSGPRYLRAYKESHFKALGSGFLGSLPMQEFLQRVRKTRVLFIGDDHANAELHARVLALLETLHAQGIRLHLGLECVGSGDENAAARYVRGELELSDFVAESARRWPGTWLSNPEVDSDFYLAVLRRARAFGATLFALEPIPRLPLYERDRLIARNVRRAARAEPSRLIVVLVGHAHLLGYGDLIARVDLPHMAIGARMSTDLARAREGLAVPADATFLEATSGVLFFAPRAAPP
jgi:hypothetical protein